MGWTDPIQTPPAPLPRTDLPKQVRSRLGDATATRQSTGVRLLQPSPTTVTCRQNGTFRRTYPRLLLKGVLRPQGTLALRCQLGRLAMVAPIRITPPWNVGAGDQGGHSHECEWTGRGDPPHPAATILLQAASLTRGMAVA